MLLFSLVWLIQVQLQIHQDRSTFPSVLFRISLCIVVEGFTSRLIEMNSFGLCMMFGRMNAGLKFWSRNITTWNPRTPLCQRWKEGAQQRPPPTDWLTDWLTADGPRRPPSAPPDFKLNFAAIRKMSNTQSRSTLFCLRIISWGTALKLISFRHFEHPLVDGCSQKKHKDCLKYKLVSLG